jgi:hypothetical protein
MDKITIRNPKNTLLPHAPVAYNEFSCEVDSLADVSDGYHTIAELYDHRITLYISLCKMIDCCKVITASDLERLNKIRPWRSKIHGDGNPAYEGWFIMGIGKEKGGQISYHLPLSRWDETDFAETLEKAPEWDGHTSLDVLERLKAL